MRKYSSPDRVRPVQKQAINKRIPVVYYLCRNHHLEHPHFIEVPVSSNDGLYLRDVIKRLIELRGKGMPSLYSWSCKRSYKNGFVWHDLSEDDPILPIHGNEYVLKGSELLDKSPPIDRNTHHEITNTRSIYVEPPTISKLQEASSSSSPIHNIKESKRLHLPPSNGNITINNHREEQSTEKSPSWDGNNSPRTTEFRVYKPANASDASTQTEENKSKKVVEKPLNTITRGVSTEITNSPTSEIEEESTTSSSEKVDTLESLIRADAKQRSGLRVLDEDEVYVSTAPRTKATNVIMQIITCGSLPVKGKHSFAIVPTYKSRLSNMKYPSSKFGGSVVLSDVDSLSDSFKFMGSTIGDKEYFSGSAIETKKHKVEVEDIDATLKRSNSYSAERSLKSPETKSGENKEMDSSLSKCLPRTIKISTPTRQFKNGMLRSPISDRPRISSEGTDSASSSKNISKRTADDPSTKGASIRLESFKEESPEVVKIEERLTSGARVIIQSRAPGDDSESSSSS